MHPDRVLKLMRSTHIQPKVLMERGFRFQTDLDSALRHWKQTAGEFR